MAASYGKTPVLEYFFDAEYCEILTILKNICGRLLLKMCSWNWEKIKFIHKELLHYYIKNRFFQHQYQKQVNMFVFTSWLVSHEVCIYMQYFFGVVKNISENYKPMRVWLWLVYKFTENYCRSRLFLHLLTKYIP